MTDIKIDWFEDFLGLGYHVFDVRPTIYLILDGKRKLANTWNRIIKYWPDDEIKVRFFESDTSYDFILYCQSRILLTTNVFLKSLKISEHYKRFKDEYNGSATLQLAVYFPKDEKYELEIFKFKKKIFDLKFFTDSDQENDFIVSQARERLKKH